MTNAYTSLVLIIFLSIVLVNKKQSDLFDLLSQEKGFFKWMAAMIITQAISEKMGKTGNALSYLIYAAMALNAVKNNPDIFKNLNNI